MTGKEAGTHRHVIVATHRPAQHGDPRAGQPLRQACGAVEQQGGASVGDQVLRVLRQGGDQQDRVA